MSMPSITPKNIAPIIRGCFNADKSSVFFWGQPGIGKSDCVRQARDTIAKEVEKNSGDSSVTKKSLTGKGGKEIGTVISSPGCCLIDVRLSQLDPVDLRGIPAEHNPLSEERVRLDALQTLKAAGAGNDDLDKQIKESATKVAEMIQNGYLCHTRWCPPNFLPRVERDGEVGILFLDEMSSAPVQVQAASYQLILDRRLGDYVLPEGWLIVAAGNREEDKSVSYPMPAALANRFTHFEVAASVEDWINWAFAHGIHSDVLAYIRYKSGTHLCEFDPDKEDKTFPTPRGWEVVSNYLHGASNGITDFLIRGRLGDAVGGDFTAFRSLKDMLPDLDRIVELYKKGSKKKDMPADLRFPDPSGETEVEDKTLKDASGNPVVYKFNNSSKLYLMATGLAARAKDDNIGAMWAIARDLDAEFAVLFVKDALRHCTKMMTHSDFNDWARNHTDIINTGALSK